jgi:malonyl-CoA/methylmalonyl-CoA synthetase
MLFRGLHESDYAELISIAGRSISSDGLRGAVAALASDLHGNERVAVWAESELETAIGVAAAIGAGTAAVPINPKAGPLELEHIVSDSAPGIILCRPGAELPDALAGVRRLDVDVKRRSENPLPPDPEPESPVLILYTSGTTGLPKGAVLPARAIASNLDALAEAWEWTAADVLVQGLPLFHAHGLVLGTLGPLRLGCRLIHLGRFSPEGVAAALEGDGTMLFAVPTMYHRLAEAAEEAPGLATTLGRARLLVSGSAALPAREHARIERLCGQRIVERYGLTETLMNCSVRASGERRPGYVGLPLPGVDLRLVDDSGAVVTPADDLIAEIEVRGPNLFLGYLNRPDATALAMDDGWFRTGDMASIAPDGYVQIVGRKSTDLIKTGGYRVGAGEVEGALLEHVGVAEAAVLGAPDDDLGERIVAFVVPAAGTTASQQELIDHVASLLSGHKRPREIRFLAELPRNALGKVRKTELRDAL